MSGNVDRSGSAVAAFQILHVSPLGYVHSEALTELAESVYHGLRRLGATVVYGGTPDRAMRQIVFGGHLLPELHGLADDAIIYNSEPIVAGSPWLTGTYMKLLKCHRIWDYSAENAARLRSLGADSVDHVPVGYVPELSRIGPAVEDIDVLFYGSITPRRQAILEALKARGLRVTGLCGCYGEERDKIIARAKIVLSVHSYSEVKIFEIVRAAYLLANFKAIVAECGPDTSVEPDIRDALRGVPYDAIVDACVDLSRDDAARRELANRGHMLFSNRRTEAILAATLKYEQFTADATRATSAGQPLAPRAIHLGSGKDFRPELLNLDADPACAPDAVVDICGSAICGSSVATERFGVVALQEGHFDAVIANDVLQHLTDLVSAMTNCLRLLRPGGQFQISVPYDLTPGECRDPAGVRAFNENSWLYFTDWHWHLGWTEMRFDVLSMEFKLSAFGAELLRAGKSKEQIIRTPRATASLVVVLRKRYLQDSERRGALARQPQRRQ